MKATLTVFTPAYNRAHTIGRTYASLCRQTSKDFCWLIVDDGSTDGTKELAEGWIAENKIPITYIYQQNRGMHGAHNTAYRHIDTELNTCIDSDDYMPDDAVEKIVAFWRKYGSDKYAGLIGLDVDEKHKRVIGTEFSAGMSETTLGGFYAAGGRGDKKLVYRTAVIRQYPEYPLFEGERYVGLAYKYTLIDRDYKLLTLNEPLVVVEYQADGSSATMYRQYWNNPRGFAFLRTIDMQYAPTRRRRFMSCVHYGADSIIAGDWQFIQKSPRKAMTLLALPFSAVLYLVICYHVVFKTKMKVK